MKFGYEHLCPYDGHESTLFRFEHDDQTDCVLVDAGAGVDLDDHLDDDEYLAAALVTHGHIDHYRTLGKNLRHRAPVYASPGTAAVLEHALTEARKDNDVGDVEGVLDALVPIDDWTPLVDGLDVQVAPVPAGHAVGAAGFLVRFRDDDVADPQHVFVSGDFTRRPCAGNPGLPVDMAGDLEAAFVNVSTNDEFEATATDAVEAVMERAFGGGRVVVATSGLTGVHVAYLLGHAAAALDRHLPVRVVGQAAKLYDSLGYDVPGVEAVPTFEQTAEVLDAGTVTVAGPETPSTGSTHRLFAAVRDDPAALFAQVTTSGGGLPDGAACATKSFEFGNHPTGETLTDTVEALHPENVVVMHSRTASRYRDRFPGSFVWASNESTRYVLYADGEWVRPEWMSEASIRQIEMNRYGDAGVAVPAVDGGELPSLTRREPDPAAEGVDLSRLRDAFSLGADAGAAPATREADTDGGTTADAAGGSADATAGTAGDSAGGVDAGSATGGEDPGAADTAVTTDEEFREAVLDRLATVERFLDGEPVADDATAEARVLRGDDATLLELLDDLDLADGDRVRVRVDVLDDEAEE